MIKWAAVVAVACLVGLVGASREAQLHLLPTADSQLPKPTTRPTTRPAGASVAAKHAALEIPPAFSTLLKRSVFSRTGQSAGAMAGPVVPEAGMALRGIVFDDTSFVAFVEDTMGHRTMQLRAGDSLCTGCVRQISLDGLTYELGGKTTRVAIGQNLLGVALPAPPPPAAAPAGPPPGPPGPPPPNAGPPGKGPVYGIGPNGQRIREYNEERAKATQ